MFVNFLVGFLLVVYVIVCLLLVLAILMQRSKQDGLGAAFGSGITDSVFGAQTSSVLLKFTSWLIAIFFLISIALAYLYGYRSNQKSNIQQQLRAITEPAAPAPAPKSSAPVEPKK